MKKSLLCWLNSGRRFDQAVVVVVAAHLVVVVVVAVVVGVVVAVTAVSVLVTGDAVVAAARTDDCLVGWSLAKCSFTERGGACPLPME